MYINNFSLWCDFIQRDFLEGEFKTLVENKIINGATSNPAIFKNAILNTNSYKKQIKKLSEKKPKEIYESLAIYDVQKAADILKPLYDNNDDGFISIELDPFLCDNVEESIKEGKRLHKMINRDNLMIKVPSTKAGYEVMQELIASNINVNATLVFSKEEALSCAKAFQEGLKSSSKKDVFSVISVFVSRIDRALDDKIQKFGLKPKKIGINNAIDIYENINALNIKNLKVLYASTSMNDDNYKKDYYVSSLFTKNSINTATVDTIKAFSKTNIENLKEVSIDKDYEKTLKILNDNNINIENEFVKLKEDGLEQFKKAFEEILKSLS